MDLRLPDSVMRWLGPLVITAVGGVVIVGNPISNNMLCRVTENCFVTWVSALSGWAAAAAAAVTIGSLYRQTHYQQKQTDFLLGDAGPTIDAVQHADRQGTVILRMRNWNRRSMIVRRIRLLNQSDMTSLYVAFDKETLVSLPSNYNKGWTAGLSNEMVFEPAIMIEGWVKRDDEPPLLKIKLSAYSPDGVQLRQLWSKMPIEVQFELVGQSKSYTEVSNVHLASAILELDNDQVALDTDD